MLNFIGLVVAIYLALVLASLTVLGVTMSNWFMDKMYDLSMKMVNKTISNLEETSED